MLWRTVVDEIFILIFMNNPRMIGFLTDYLLLLVIPGENFGKGRESFQTIMCNLVISSHYL